MEKCIGAALGRDYLILFCCSCYCCLFRFCSCWVVAGVVITSSPMCCAGSLCCAASGPAHSPCNPPLGGAWDRLITVSMPESQQRSHCFSSTEGRSVCGCYPAGGQCLQPVVPMGNQSTELPRGSPGSPGGRRQKQK